MNVWVVLTIKHVHQRIALNWSQREPEQLVFAALLKLASFDCLQHRQPWKVSRLA